MSFRWRIHNAKDWRIESGGWIYKEYLLLSLFPKYSNGVDAPYGTTINPF